MAELGRPSLLPRHGTTPAVGDTAITQPTELQKDTGFLAGFLRRQWLNWLFNLTYQWIGWFDRIQYRTSDLFPDQALNLGNAPTVPGGLSAAAGEFKARAYVNGYAIPLTDSPAYSYSTNSDTYWDLKDTGWTPAVVASGAAAPAVTANSVRVYGVRTDGAGRTLLILDNRLPAIKADTALALNRNVLFGDDRRGSAAQRAEPRRTVRFNWDVTANGYTTLEEWLDDGAAGMSQHGAATRLYFRHASKSPVLVRGASWDGTQWTRDPATTWVSMTELVPTAAAADPTPYTFGRHRLIPTAPSTFADSLWFTDWNGSDPLGGFAKKTTGIDGSIHAGYALSNDEGAEYSRFYCYCTESGAAPRQLAVRYGGYLRQYHVAPGQSVASVSGGELVQNCRWDTITDKWILIDVAKNATKIEYGENGVKVYTHRPADGTSWDDLNTGTAWRLARHQDVATKTVIMSAAAIEGTGYVSAALGATLGVLNPTDGNLGVYWDLTLDPDAAVHFSFPLRFQSDIDQWLITGVKLHGYNSLPQATYPLQIAVIRKPITGNCTPEPLKVGGSSGKDSITVANGTNNSFVDTTLTVDTAASVRRIDLKNYNYWIVGYAYKSLGIAITHAAVTVEPGGG